MRKNQVILIYGAPAAGKYTMAKRISSVQGFLLDNHYFHDMFKGLIEVLEDQKKEYFDEVDALKESFLDIITRFYPKKEFVRYIFTSCIAEWEEENILKFQKFALSLDADFIPIELKADTYILKKRCQTEYRKWRKKISDPEKLESVIKEAFYASAPFEHENKLLINTTSLSEDETFEKIENHLKQFSGNIK